MKTIAFMPRREDVDRADFRLHYETRHVPLALRHFSFDKYVRNHIVGGGAELGFDCYSEFWQDDPAEAGRLMETEVGDIMRADEAKFTNRPAIRAALADERLVLGQPRGVDPTPTAKTLLLLRAGEGADHDALITCLADLRVSRVTVDFISGFRRSDPPFDAVASVWCASADLPNAIAFPAGWSGTIVPAEACETLPEALAADR